MVIGHTTTWNKEGLKEYKALCDEAIKNKHNSFVHKGSLQDVGRAKKLIKQLEKAFNDPVMKIASMLYNSNQVTIPYED
jgi:ABC-type uncharacterized transport system substrate-binding protein